MSNALVRTAVLELGLEDWIPIPEAMSNPEILAAVGSENVETAIRNALVDLLRPGKIVICRGRWDQEPDPLDRALALRLLNEPVWYRFRIDDPNEERLYFVNVENIRPAARPGR